MTTDLIVPVFPPGVHDIISRPCGTGIETGRPITEFVCSAGDYAGIEAHTDSPEEMRWARVVAYEHAARHRRRPCHTACVDEPECLYDGDQS